MQRNGSDEIGGHFNMHTGAGDITQIGATLEWNHQAATGYYPGECSNVRGSGGEYYPPDANKETPISIFNGELWYVILISRKKESNLLKIFFPNTFSRPLDLYYTEEIQVEGINLLKYSATERSVDNGTKYPESECYSYGESLPSGVMNVSACRYGAPVFISFPHYYAADPYYLSFIDGLKPSRKDHEFYIALEPLTGVPVEVAARLQANILIRPSPNIALFQEAPYMFFPLIWFEQKVRISDELIAEIKIAINVPTIGYVCTGFITGIGLILLVWLKLQRENDRDNDDILKTGVDFKKPSINTPEASPLMKSDQKPQIQIISQYSDKVPNGTTPTPVKLAPLATTEIDSEVLHGVEKESIMMPQ